ncbi:hypothetical protein RHMOL_Rhmol10G0141100 [Rhododendron molle]|uniref:Uncharacterized protein n=1 Tax=Rhododendron molle TaxID=49168 RepID=A0ACC0M1Y1_RHOML|nr:hypothetical protein RHMOL_Rhmol10G0141100 [Rhododendron molle]
MVQGANWETFFDSGLAIEEALQTRVLTRTEASSSAVAPKAKPRPYTGNSTALFGANNYATAATTGNTTTQTSSNYIADINQVQTPQRTRNHSQPCVFANFEAPLSSVLEKLVKSGHLRPSTPTPLPPNLPPSHNPNVFYAYHQMPGHHTDSCFRLRHAIQDLVENGTLPTPPAKPNVISNSLLQHNQQVNQISLSSTISPSSTIFNPTDHITSENNPKPIVTAPVEPDVNMLSVEWEMEDKMAEWIELGNDWTERYHLGFPATPQVDQAWVDQLEAEWEAARADPLDGFSLFMFFYQPEPASLEEEEYVWDPQPTAAQLAWDQNFHLEEVGAKDDVDERYLEFYAEGEVIPNERRQLGSFNPLVNKLSEAVRKFHHEHDSTDDIVPVEQPRLYIALEDDCLVMALDGVPKDLWDVDEIVDLNTNLLPADLWDVDKVVDIQMGNEVWTVNSALVDAGFWDTPFVTNPRVPFEEAVAQDPAFWEGLIMEDLSSALGQDSPTTVASVNKGKPKMADIPTDFWDFDDNMTSWWDIANVTRSG